MKARVLVLVAGLAVLPLQAQQENVGEMQAIVDSEGQMRNDSRALYLEAIAALRNLEMVKAAELFDRQIVVAPGDKPRLWERGIALYFAERFDDCADQFVAHHSVNSGDVENAAWHYACVARSAGHEAARESLMPANDQRVPMTEVWGLFNGTLNVDDVLQAAESNGELTAANRKLSLFYAHLYIALWHESHGESEQVMDHLQRGLQGISSGTFMELVARVHLELRRRQAISGQ